MLRAVTYPQPFVGFRDAPLPASNTPALMVLLAILPAPPMEAPSAIQQALEQPGKPVMPMAVLASRSGHAFSLFNRASRVTHRGPSLIAHDLEIVRPGAAAASRLDLHDALVALKMPPVSGAPTPSMAGCRSGNPLIEVMAIRPRYFY
jgi:hypothetical protein